MGGEGETAEQRMGVKTLEKKMGKGVKGMHARDIHSLFNFVFSNIHPFIDH